MKLSSSTLCGCCFCCYCHCWLMMLLMVSSVVHVSPEMSTTITTTTKKYTKLNSNNNFNNNNNNNNNNNYAYQSTMTEFVHLNKIITNRTNRTQTTLNSLLTTQPPTQGTSIPTIIKTSTTDNQVNSYRTFEKEHKTITTVHATTQKQKQKQKQSTTFKSTSLDATQPSAIQLTTTTTKLPAPEKIQRKRKQPTEQQNLYDTTAMMATIEELSSTKEESETKRPPEHDEDVFYTFDNSIGYVVQEPATSKIIATTEKSNYVVDKSIAYVPQTTTVLRIGEHDENASKNKRNNNEKLGNNKDANKDFSFKIKQQQQQYNDMYKRSQNGSSSRSSSSSISRSNSNNNSQSTSNDNLNINTNNNNSNNKMILRQETANIFSLNPTSNNNKNNATLLVTNNGNNSEQPQNLLTLTVTETRAAATTLKLMTLLNKNQNMIRTASTASRTSPITLLTSSTAVAINPLLINSPHNLHSDYRKSISYQFKNHNKSSIVTQTTAATTTTTSMNLNNVDNNSYPKEIISYSNDTQHHRHHHHHSHPRQQLQMPATTLATTIVTAIEPATALITYSPLNEHHHMSQMRRPLLLHRHSRQAPADEEQNEKCRMFIEGDAEKNELYSPDYPNDYPKNINCTRVIIAPKGQIIRLDFRNSFHIEEKEECKFDFLEIRDGQYGFSNLIGKYCGTDFPPEITSKERYLWLHFHSDESIEYSGFTAVYEFIDRNRDAPSTDLNCTIEKDGFEGFINATDVPTEIKDTVIRNKIPLDCMWRIQVQDKWKIQVKFVDFKLAKPNDCETNFLDIFPEQTVMPLRVKNFCGSAGEGITSESNILHMRFYAEQIAINSTFSILYTAFRDRGSSSCVEGEYDCEDATCISAELQCNGRDNCKFRWDEEGCKQEDEGQSEHMIIIITVFGLILGGMVITFLVNCVRKIMHDQKIIREVPVLSDGIYHIDSFILDAPKAVICVGLQDDYKLSYRSGFEHDYPEHIRQSKESKLDEMGRNSKARSRDNISIVSPRQKHSQTSLQILDDVSSRYYREMELQTKNGFKEKDHSILRHDMIVQTSLCSTDDSSTTITEPQQQQKQHQHEKTAIDGVGGNACDMGCQTRESLFATASLMRQKSKTPSIAGSQRTIEGVPPPPRFSTFGYDAAQIAPPPPPPTVSTLSRRNMLLPQESLEMEQLPHQTTHTLMMMPTHQHQQQQQQHAMQHQQPHQHLHHRPSQEICHHHHQHQQHLQQQQKQTLPRHHAQQQQLQQAHHQHIQQQQQQQQQQPHHQHHTSTTTIPPNVTQLPTPGTTVVTAISTGTSGRHKEQTTNPAAGIVGGGKNKQTKVDESKVFIDIRNSAPDVIIMTSH